MGKYHKWMGGESRGRITVMPDEDTSSNPRHGFSDASSTPAREDGGDTVDVDEILRQRSDTDDGLFDDLLTTDPIFEDKDVLRPSYTPSELPHRDEQITKIATILAAALRGDTPSNILIYGKTGTGKTACANYVSQELSVSSEKHDVPCEIVYINCEVVDTKYRVLAQLANTFIEKDRSLIKDRIDGLRSLQAETEDTENALADSTFDSVADLSRRITELQQERHSFEPVPMTGWPTDRVYSELFDALDYRRRVAIVMLDEIDKLVEKSGDETLYNLSRMNSDLANARLSIMGISNDLKFTEFLDPRVKSSLGEEEIVFPPYDASQLRDILEHRAAAAYKDGVLTDGVIPLCAALAAQEHGDARRALDLLRTAGEIAERSPTEEVTESHVHEAQDRLELNRIVEVVTTLPAQSKLVLYAIIMLENNGISDANTGRVYNTYQQLCEHLDVDVLTQRRVTDLVDELDMLGIVNAAVVSKGRYGRTKEINLSVPAGETEQVVKSDSRLQTLEESSIDLHTGSESRW